MTRFALALVVLVFIGVALVGGASASQLVARNASNVSLEVDAKGRALVSYNLPGGTRKHVVVWGAVDARTPAASAPQVSFSLDYTGGVSAFKSKLWTRFQNRCGRYTGPAVPWLVKACTAPDGSHWALQSWQRTRPFHGRAPWKPWHDAWELRISHWMGEVARLEVWQDWKYSARFEAITARVTYRGAPATHPPRGTPGWQAFVRRGYFETFNSGYGAGWWGHDALSIHPPGGIVCAIFAANLTDRYGTNRGAGERYRITVVGPGVTPDVMWEGAALGPWNPSDPAKVRHEQQVNAIIGQIADPDPRCAEL